MDTFLVVCVARQTESATYLKIKKIIWSKEMYNKKGKIHVIWINFINLCTMIRFDDWEYRIENIRIGVLSC